MKYRALIVTILVLCLTVLTACSEGPDSTKQLTYDDIKNTGLANNCPELLGPGRGAIAIEPSQTYIMSDLCLQPTRFFVKEESSNRRKEAEFVEGKLLTRYTSSLTQILGPVTSNPDKSLTFVEEDGIDFQPVTVLLPGGEQVPFFFTLKGLVAKSQPGIESINSSTDFEGEFNVPSYRGATFLDPKGRGVATGYDNAVALPAGADAEDLTLANVKRTEIAKGKISLAINKVDSSTGEVAGTFESEQPSDTDLGAQEPVEVKIKGNFYAIVQPE